MLEKIAMVLVVACFFAVAAIIMVGCILDFLGFYDRIGKMEHHLDNDEFDYGHDVNHKDYE